MTQLPLGVFSLNLFFGKSAEKMKGLLKSDKNNGTLHEDQHTFFIVSRSVLLRMRNVSEEICKENQNTFYLQQIFPQNIMPLMI